MLSTVLNATKDTYIQSNLATTNYGAVTTLWLGEVDTQVGHIHRILLDFDYLEAIPLGSIIESVTLSMFYDGTEAASSNRIFYSYRIIRAWVESETTWNIARAGVNWGTAGCAHQTTDIDASVSLGPVGRVNGAAAAWIHDTLSVSAFQNILNNQLTFEGILIRRIIGTDELDDGFRHRSKENTTSPGAPAWRPYLTINYTPPGAQFQAVMIFTSFAQVVPDILTLQATTTVVNQTVTIARLRTSEPCTIDWGDGATSQTDNTNTARSRTYAVAGTYNIRVSQASRITQIRLESAALGRLNTAQLRRSAIVDFAASAITGSTINSADMVDWRPTEWLCHNMPASGTYNLNSLHMVNWNPTSVWWVSSMPAGTYNFNSEHMVNWRPATWFLTTMPTGTYSINTADMVNWRPVSWRCHTMPAGALTISAASNISGWTRCNDVHAQNNSFTTAVVDRILQGMWGAFPGRTVTGGTINVAGTNQAPSGVFQAANPPTTGREFAFELLNDSQNINPTRKWATVTMTA